MYLIDGMGIVKLGGVIEKAKGCKKMGEESKYYVVLHAEKVT